MKLTNKTNVVKAIDRRTGDHSEYVAACNTPYGRFRSVACARDAILANHPAFWWDIRQLDDAELAMRVYKRIYAKCRKQEGEWHVTPVIMEVRKYWPAI